VQELGRCLDDLGSGGCLPESLWEPLVWCGYCVPEVFTLRVVLELVDELP